ncbi:hybrid sensor histidine kinase/response regulator [Tropicibacter oceani]|uniref:histidine kinase n=1 Tax=Tropicibacter oceani TaxID=3058420 RepID=A0ABY8QCW0_9RHOB|nr:PAS domain-containing hybrid sensor histidine kinase/response regulator [Tropicibacter oceani]WGW02400.1 ATP-binding protein [Tropicibacter oceani]
MNRAQVQMPPPETSGGRRGKVIAVLASLACIAAIAALILQIVQEFRYNKAASSDNVHWSLSQAEVEFLELQRALDRAALTPQDPAAQALVVEEFDIFYSRIATFSTGSLYQPLRAVPEFGGPLAVIRDRLKTMVPVIDGPPAALAEALPSLAGEAAEIRPILRAATTGGLQYFAQVSDLSRSSVASTLMWLAIVTLGLLLALLFLLGHTRRIGTQTERRGQELASAYSRLHTILETSLDAVIVSDLEGRILSFNPAAERIFGHCFEEVYHRNIADIIIPPKYREAHRAGMDRFRRNGEMKVVGQGRVRLEAQRNTGEVFPVEMALERARTGDEDIIVSFLRDISHRVASENELVEARDKALEGEKAKAEFLAMMTHEIRTPLNGLLGNLSLLARTSLTAEQSRYLRNMDISGAVLMRHVDSVLDVARFEAGRTEGNQEIVHVGKLVQDIADSQTGAAEARNTLLQWGWSGDPVHWALLDATRLSQVLLNIVGNAIKFTRNGRIIIEAEQVDDDGPHLEFRVIDTGPGIAEADLDRVFQDFQTVGDTGGEREAGTGLGLGIARRFVEAMGGRIGVESTLGEGSVFWVRVPLVPAKAPAAANRAAPRPRPDMPPCDVLLVEDNEINLTLAQDMLQLLGHRVTVARNGQQAVEAAAARAFDLILMDIRMPVLDGLGATRAIREGDGPCRDVPVVALSANVLPSARSRFMHEGMSGFLAKPLILEDLQQAIATFVKAPMPGIAGDAPQPRKAMTPDQLCAGYQSELDALFARLGALPDDAAGLKALADEAHRVAGSAGVFGQPLLHGALIALEEAAENGDPATLRQAVKAAHEARARSGQPSLG